MQSRFFFFFWRAGCILILVRANEGVHVESHPNKTDVDFDDVQMRRVVDLSASSGNAALRQLHCQVVSSKRMCEQRTTTTANVVDDACPPSEARRPNAGGGLTCLPLEVIVHIIECVGGSDLRDDKVGGGGYVGSGGIKGRSGCGDGNNRRKGAFYEQWKCALSMMSVCSYVRAACVVWTRSVRRVELKSGTCVRDINSVVHLATLIELCPNIQVLDLNNCGVTDCAVVAIAQGCSQLVHLDIRWCFGVSDASGVVLAHKCTKLTHLYVTCCNLTDETIAEVAHNRTLTHVDVRFCPVTHKSVIELACKCDLVELHLCAFRPSRSTSDMTMLASLCPRLTHLSGRTTDADIADVSTFCTELVHLDVTMSHYLTDEGISALVSGRASLQYLEMRACDALTELSVVRVAERYASSLTHLDISECKYAITIEAIKAVAFYCTNLLCLSISECSNVNDDFMHILSRRCPKLRELDIGMTSVSDIGIVSLFAPLHMSPSASAVSSPGADSESEASVNGNSSGDGESAPNECATPYSAHGIEGRPELRRLAMWDCAHVTDVTLAVLSDLCPNLTHLDVRMCPKVTSYGLLLVRSGCVHIQSLFSTEPDSAHLD